MTVRINRAAVSHRLGSQTVWWVDYEVNGRRGFKQLVASDADEAARIVARSLGIIR